MNAKRWISGIALGALLVSQTMPAQAGRMLCGMKAPERIEACSGCDDTGSTPAGGVLRARSCCRIAPSETPRSTPVIVSAPRRAASEDGVAFSSAPAPTIVADFSPAVARVPAAALSAHPLLESPTRTTVLRN